jgi:putative FmdB family regulatory protein
MPTYEYTCRDCGHTFDIVQSMWDETLTMCPECGGSLRKVFAPPAISFRGSGFYATDHGKKSKSAAESRSDGDKRAGDKETGDTKAGDKRSDSKGDAAAADGSKASGKDTSGQAAEKPSKAAKKEPAPS